MLSRVADSLFWMSRYIERADNLARILDVNVQILLDFAQLDDAHIKEHWDPILRSVGRLEQFEEQYDHANSHTVTEFLTFSRDNPESVVSCLCSARENARMIRDQISSELWEAINEMYIFLRSASAMQVWEQGAYAFYSRIMRESYLVQGLMAATFPQDVRNNFFVLGRFLERAFKVTQILDTKYHILLPQVSDVGGAVDTVQWGAVLKSCSAYEAFHQRYVTQPEPRKIIEMLVLSDNFPRSVRFCVTKVRDILESIAQNSESEGPVKAIAILKELTEELAGINTEFIVQKGMHEYLMSIQDRLNAANDAIFQAYLFRPPVDMENEIALQHQQQLQ